MKAPVHLYIGRTAHVREQPFRRSFSHAIAMIGIDIDRLAEANAAARLFSVNRANAIAFRETDHGARDPAVPLRLWAEAQFTAAGLDIGGGPIELITFPRMLGHGFAPISVWLGRDPGGVLRAVIYEVHNTFGEAHAYVAPFDPSGGRTGADKEFHVSPFFDVSGRYRFTLRQPGARLELIVENMASGGRAHVASLLARRRPLNDVSILGWLVRMPFSGIGVVIAIHWQAIGLFLRGARFRNKPAQRPNQTTRAAPEAVAEPRRPRRRA
ncbi:MAG: DUF1365 domain-containing protein [Alphaproteobacteria bacterium]|nr:DUF1365 domain-containing protein [Alphaproteobacteria bacterium]